MAKTAVSILFVGYVKTELLTNKPLTQLYLAHQKGIYSCKSPPTCYSTSLGSPESISLFVYGTCQSERMFGTEAHWNFR